MTIGELKKINLTAQLNRQIIYTYIEKSRIFLITSFCKDNYVITKKSSIRNKGGYWIIFKELNEKKQDDFKKFTISELDKFLKRFIKQKETNTIKEKSKNPFILYYKENNINQENLQYIDKIITLPSLYELFYRK